jgi:hypothetical protein
MVQYRLLPAEINGHYQIRGSRETSSFKLHLPRWAHIASLVVGASLDVGAWNLVL